jgi:predicted nucleic acid-binding protein
MPRAQARAEIEDLSLWQPVCVSPELLDSGWKIEDRFKLSFWDALIVAAAGAADCSHLLSQNLQAGADYGGVRVINPFATGPRS